ncbi:hypothetical protein ACFX13_031598 [Malus domestica]
MAITFCGSNGNYIKIDGAGSSDELDYLPLIQWRNLLLVGRQNLKSLIGVTVKEEDELSKSQIPHLISIYNMTLAASFVHLEVV